MGEVKEEYPETELSVSHGSAGLQGWQHRRDCTAVQQSHSCSIRAVFSTRDSCVCVPLVSKTVCYSRNENLRAAIRVTVPCNRKGLLWICMCTVPGVSELTSPSHSRNVVIFESKLSKRNASFYSLHLV